MSEERFEGWIVDNMLAQFGIEKQHIEKVKSMIDMITFTKEDGKDIILIQIGDNVEVKIRK